MTSKRRIHSGIVLLLVGVVAFIGLRVYQRFNQRIILVSQDSVWVVDVRGQEGVLNRRMGENYVLVPIKFESHNYGKPSFRLETTAEGAGLSSGFAIGCLTPSEKTSETLFCEASKGFTVPVTWRVWVGGSAEKVSAALNLP